MATPAKIWTTGTGEKVPLPVMKDSHLLNCFVRCKEIVMADTVVKTLERYDNKLYEINITLLQMRKSPITVEEAARWVEIFEEEIKRRKLVVPKVTRHTMEANFMVRRLKKEQKLLENKEFDELFF